MAVASVAILTARTRPILPALACWAAASFCVAFNMLPAGAAIALSLAVLTAVLSDRLPQGLTWALFAWLSSIGAGWTILRIADVPTNKAPEVLSHTAAALAVWWVFAAGLARRWPNRWAAEARAAFLMTAATACVAATCVLAYSAVGVTYWRLTQGFWRVTAAWELRPIYLPSTAWQGLIDIALVTAAVQLSRWVVKWKPLPTATLWLVLFAGAWWGLMLPPSPALTNSRWPGWLTWLVWIQTAWSWTLLGGVLAWVWQGRRRQERAWPNDLGSLVRVPRPWPGLESTAVALGLVLMPLGLWHAFSAGLGSTPAVRLTTWDMAAAGLALSILIGWHWSRTVAELSLSLWTAALVALGATTALEMTSPRVSIELLPAVHTGALAGLICASALWFWLAGFWRQQRLGGRAWTTSGRLIPLAERVGFLAAALAVLVSSKLALWPRMQYGSADDSSSRLIVGSVMYALLVAACLFAAIRVRRATMLYLAGLAGTAWGIFLWLRC